MTKPLVSIHCITYNHENYIAQALEGFLLQKTNFPIEIVICDDASTDKTANIIREYADKYPNLIVPLLQSENQYSQGVKPGFDIVMPRCQGKYIAHCEGDDYWIDPYKLQKQVDFMEGNPEYSFIFHDCEILNQNSGSRQLRVGKRVIDETVDLVSAIKQNNMPTASILHRNVLDRNSTQVGVLEPKKEITVWLFYWLRKDLVNIYLMLCRFIEFMKGEFGLVMTMNIVIKKILIFLSVVRIFL